MFAAAGGFLAGTEEEGRCVGATGRPYILNEMFGVVLGVVT